MPDSESTASIELANESQPTMSLQQKRFYASDLCTQAKLALTRLAEDPAYVTNAGTLNLDSRTFVERHLAYLSSHPQVKLEGYISNLKLMTRKSRR